MNNVLVVVIIFNCGLVGVFNSNIVKECRRSFFEVYKGKKV